MYEWGKGGERGGAGGRRGKEGGEGMRRSEGMLEVIEQVGVANGDHQGKSFNPRSLTTSTFILGQMTVVLVAWSTLHTLPPHLEIIYT